MTKPVDTELSQHEGGKPPTKVSRTRRLLIALLGFGAADLLVLNLWAVPNLLTHPNATTTDLRAAQSGEQPEAAVVPGILRPAKPKDPEAESEAVAQLEEQDGYAEAEAVAPGDDDAPEQAADPSPEEQAVAVGQADRDEPPEPSEPPVRRMRAFQAQLQRPSAEIVPGAAPPEPTETYAAPDFSLLTPYAIRTAQRSVRVLLDSGDSALANGPFGSMDKSAQPLMQIYFSVGNFWLGPNGKVVLERMLSQLTADERPILILGVADPSGPELVNEKLSDARAQSVAEWMLAHGVDAARIQTRAIGHAGAVGNALDRRVDIWLGGSR